MEIDPKAFVEEIRRLAAENPDKTAVCQYADEDGNGVCIVGNALINLGMPPELFRAYEGLNVRQLAGDLLPNMPLPVVEWAREAQSIQDDGDPWEQAVAEADLRYNLESVI